MRLLSKATCGVGIVAVFALTASITEARSVKATRLDNAYNRVTDPGGTSSNRDSNPGGTSVPYDPGGVPYPTGHGGLSASPDFQLHR